ncbi:MAG: hypothetical protein LBU62_12425 [Bacteroidales bacterium]|jgi:hypothetical protein|nr:hypothetical protein [Bacteroidales bacterium]
MEDYKINFIKNPPTVENLKSLYESEMYQNLLAEFDKRSKHKLDTREQNITALYTLLTDFQKGYLILNIPFEEVVLEFEKCKDEFLDYAIARIEFFINEEDDNPDGEFPEGEEPGEEDKSVILETFGVEWSFFINIFCEFYILKTGDKERLLHFLKTTRMPFAKKYAGQITKLYKQIKSA